MRGKRGQMLITAVLGIVLVLLTVSSVLIATYLSGLNLSQFQFRETVTQIYFGSRGAVATGLADISKKLNNKAKTSPPSMYQNYTDLEKYPDAIHDGLEMISNWQKDILKNYPAVGLSLNITGPSPDKIQPQFYCDWNDSDRRVGYSKAVANVSINLLNYGFEGFKDQIIIEFNASIKGLSYTDGNNTSFIIDFVREKEYLSDQMVKDLISVYFEKYYNNTYRSFKETNIASIKYMSSSENMYVINYTTGLNTVKGNLKSLSTEIYAIPWQNFTYPNAQNDLNWTIHDVDLKFNNYTRDRESESKPWLKLAWSELWEMRPRLDPNSTVTVINPSNHTNTEIIIDLIDTILSQLRPHIRVVATDFRGITVSVYGELEPVVDLGPLITITKAQPNPCIKGQEITLRAKADDRSFGNSNISKAEYFIQDNQPSQSQYGNGINMTFVDGLPFGAVREVGVTISSSSFSPGIKKIWVHGQDAKGNWGPFQNVGIKISLGILHIQSITWNSPGNKIIATVKILDDTNSPIEGVQIDGHWTISGGNPKWVHNTTRSDGTCSFKRDYNHDKSYTFTVDTVSKNGYTWIEGSKSATYPHPYP